MSIKKGNKDNTCGILDLYIAQDYDETITLFTAKPVSRTHSARKICWSVNENAICFPHTNKRFIVIYKRSSDNSKTPQDVLPFDADTIATLKHTPLYLGTLLVGNRESVVGLLAYIGKVMCGDPNALITKDEPNIEFEKEQDAPSQTQRRHR